MNDSAEDILERLEEAGNYKDFVLKELRKRELRLGEIRTRIRELEREAKAMEPHELVKKGDASVIKTLSESRRDNARKRDIEQKKLEEAKEDFERARERLEMANEELEELRAMVEQGD